MSDIRADKDWLSEVRRDYLDSADRKIAALRQAIENLDRMPSDQAARQHLHTLLHNLIGSGASYGFSSISVVARRLSSALKRAKNERMISDTGLIPLLHNGLAELRRAFEREREEMGGE